MHHEHAFMSKCAHPSTEIHANNGFDSMQIAQVNFSEFSSTDNLITIAKLAHVRTNRFEDETAARQTRGSVAPVTKEQVPRLVALDASHLIDRRFFFACN